MHTAKRIAANFLIIAVSVLVALLAMELLLRTFGNQGAYTASLYPRDMLDRNSPTLLRAGFSGKFKASEVSGEIHINTHGLRDRERPYNKVDKFRILALGDSFTFGHGVDYRDSYISILEERLKEHFGQIEVINAGVPNIGPQTYLQILENEGLKYDPDLILVNFFVGNDVHNVVLESPGDAEVGNEPIHVLSTKPRQSAAEQFKGFMRSHVHLYSFTTDRLKSIPAVASLLQRLNIASGYDGDYVIRILENEYDNTYKEKWQIALEALNSINAKGIPSVVVAIPSREQVDDERRSKALDQLGYAHEEIDIHHPNKILQSHCKKTGIGLIDLLPEFRKEALHRHLYFEVDPHFSIDGNELAAEIVARELTNHIPPKSN